MISLAGISKHYGGRTLFSSVNLTIGLGERIGLVGPNGSGKTTLLEILGGSLEPDEGAVSKNKRANIGYLRQEVAKYSGRNLLEELLAGHERLAHLKHQLEMIEEEMRGTSGEAELEELAARHGEIEASYEQEGGYDLPAEGKKILGGLGFAETDLDRPTEEFSGGWLMRLSLAKLLLLEPDLLLLDEPTNYLDLESVVWLEGRLRGYAGSLIVVSHDRELLNNLCNKIWELDDLKVISYTGNYNDYIEAKEVREEGLQAQRKAQDRFLAKEQRFIERFRYKNTKAKAVQSRIKRLEKMDLVGDARRDQSVRFTLPAPKRSVRIQIALKSVRKAYGTQVVYDSLDFHIERGEKIALVGPNGAGKSTLMKILAGHLDIDDGERVVGRDVAIGYFAQHQIEALDFENTILEEVAAGAPGMVAQQVRAVLGRFLFTKDDVFKKIKVLSGGEKARVAFAKLLVSPPNLILLDEPTSHLDIRSREIIEEAFAEYEGSLVMISHDRRFLDGIAAKVVEVGGGGIKEFLGSYSDWVASRVDTGMTLPDGAAAPKPGTSGGGARGGKRSKEKKRAEAEARNALHRKLRPLQKEIAKVESDIERLEGDVAAFESKMADPEFYGESEEFGEAFRKYHEKKAVIASKTERWEELSLQVEAIRQEGGGD